MANPYTPFHADWLDFPLTTTPITAAALEYIEAGITTASQLDVKGFRSVNAYGAVQDGSTDCTAFVAACRAALVADGGGTMFFPPGVTRMNTSAFELTDGIDWQGSGKLATTVYFPTDAGAGTYALTHNTQAGLNAPNIRNMNLLGPGTNSAIGTAPCGMNCIKLAYKSHMEHVWIFGWNRGLTLLGDHNTFRNVDFERCMDGVYLGAGWLAKGDFAFYNCVFGGDLKRAGVYITSDNNLDHSAFYSCHFVGSPFGILGGAAGSATMMIDTILLECGFEQVGNGAVSDLRSGGQASWNNCVIDRAGYSQSNTYKDSGLASDYFINLPGAGTTGGYIRQGFQPFTSSNMAVGAYNIGTAFPVYGGITLTADMFGTAGGFWINDLGDLYQGSNPTGTYATGDILELTTASVVQRATGTPATKFLLGVVAQDEAQPLVKLRTGGGSFTVNCEAIASAGVPLVQATGNYHKVAPQSAYPANPVIGYSYAASSAGQVVCSLNFNASTVGGAQGTYTATNVVADRAFDANAASGAADLAALKVITNELAMVTGTLIADLRARGIVL